MSHMVMHRSPVIIFFAVTFIIISLSAVDALYEHHIGEYDWSHRSVGLIRSSIIHDREVVVCTDDGVLASLDINNGSIIWRQLLPQYEAILGMGLDKRRKRVYSISSSDNSFLYPNLAAWSLDNGSLQKMTRSFRHSDNHNHTSDRYDIVFGSTLVIAWSGTAIHAYNAITAEHVYSWTHNRDDAILYVSTRPSPSNYVDILCGNEGSVWFYAINDLGETSSAISHQFDKNSVAIGLSGSYAAILSSSTIYGISSSSQQTPPILYEHLEPFPPQIRRVDQRVIMIQSSTGSCRFINLTSSDSSYVLPFTGSHAIVSGRQLLSQTKSEIRIASLDSTPSVFQYNMDDHGNVTSFICHQDLCAITSSDSSYSILDTKASVIKFTREEGLAYPTCFLMADYPRVKELSNEFPPLIQDRIKMQMKMITSFVSNAISSVQKTSLATLLSSKNALPFDSTSLGVRKVVIVVSKMKVFGLCSLSGRILWSLFLGPFHVSGEYMNVFLIPDIIVVTKRNILQLDILTGAILHQFTVKSDIVAGVLFPIPQSVRRSFLSLSTRSGAVIFPDYILPSSISSWYPDGLYFHHAVLSDNAIQGIHLTISNDTIDADIEWRYALPSSVVLRCSACNDPEEHIPQPAIVRNGQAVFKYFGRSFRAVLTSFGTTLSLVIMDSITGFVLHQNEHPHCASTMGSVHLVVVENLVVYSFYNSRNMHFHIASVELYHSDFASQSFIFPHAICALGATKTAHGVSNKQIIIGICTGQLYLFEPLTAQFASSVLSPLIHVNALSIINYNSSIGRLSSIIASPTELESASVVAGYGLDIFVTRVHPSGSFDILDPDFNLPFLLATVAIVGTGILFAAQMVNTKHVSSVWV
uniref:ER membrane protein complex subunit 1 n=1 Tax=Spongospora subterranea TaxID=70186 RepID=A0A0H5R8Z5_9EUKA|eukprot:CRZ10251.1 hypothetical protein [Spongospora subterranea]